MHPDRLNERPAKQAKKTAHVPFQVRFLGGVIRSVCG
jgi:hypothetical protein